MSAILPYTAQMNARATEGEAYDTPCIEDYGSLVELTADVDLSFELVRSVAMLAVVSAPIVLPGTGGGSAPDAGGAPQPPAVDLGSPGPGGTLGDLDQGGSDLSGGGTEGPSGGLAGDRASGGAGTGGGGAAGEGGGGGAGDSIGSGKLPFTGLLVPVIGGLGMALSLAGTWMRQRLRVR